jgi:hypothetical protein
MVLRQVLVLVWQWAGLQLRLHRLTEPVHCLRLFVVLDLAWLAPSKWLK